MLKTRMDNSSSFISYLLYYFIFRLSVFSLLYSIPYKPQILQSKAYYTLTNLEHFWYSINTCLILIIDSSYDTAYLKTKMKAIFYTFFAKYN